MHVMTIAFLACTMSVQPAQASGAWFLVAADSLGATIINAEEYRNQYLPDSARTTLSRSGLLADSMFNEAIRHQSSAQTSDDMRRMIDTGTWMVIIDLVGVLNQQEQAFTNVAEEGFACPRTFISGEVLSDTGRSICEQAGLIVHEWRHARDFVDCLAPSYFATQTETMSFEQDMELLEYEYRGFNEHMRTLALDGCLEENPFGRAYVQHGAYGLRRMIAEVYGIFERHPQRRQRIEAWCRWSPVSFSINTAP